MSLRSRNARQHFRRATLYRNVQEKCRPRPEDHTLCEPAQSKCASTFHKRTCFFLEFYRKNAAAQNLGPHFARVCAIEMHLLQHFTTATFYGNLQEKLGHRSQDHTLCKPAQSKCTSTFQKSHFIRIFTGKMLGPRTEDHTL